MCLDRIQKEREIKLPKEYLNFITDVDIDQEYFFSKNPDSDDGEGTGWFFLKSTMLQEIIPMSFVK